MKDTHRIAVLNSLQIAQKINRLAHQVLEDNYDEKELIIVGIASNGYIFAQKLVEILSTIAPFKIMLAELNMNKDNPGDHPITLTPHELDYHNKVIVLVDDVVNSARTMIYAMQPFQHITTKKIRTVVLVDRNHKRYPIAADFVGLSLATT